MTRAFLNRIKRLNNKGKISRHLTGFGIGIFIGYGLGLIRVHENAVQLMQLSKAKIENLVANGVTDKLSAAKEFITVQLERLLSFSPNMDFLSDVVAYQAAVIAIAIPLSLEVVSRISERYKSGAITKEFNRQSQTTFLLLIALIDACLSVLLKFFINGMASSIERLLSWIIFSLFILSNLLLLAFFRILIMYLTQTSFLIEKLSQKIDHTLDKLNSFKNMDDGQLVILQKELVNSLDGIGDILIFETTQKRNEEYIINGLNQVQSVGQEIFKIAKSDHRNKIERVWFFRV